MTVEKGKLFERSDVGYHVQYLAKPICHSGFCGFFVFVFPMKVGIWQPSRDLWDANKALPLPRVVSRLS